MRRGLVGGGLRLSPGFNPQGASGHPAGMPGLDERAPRHAGMGPGRPREGSPPGRLTAPYFEPPLLSGSLLIGHCVLDPGETDS